MIVGRDLAMLLDAQECAVQCCFAQATTTSIHTHTVVNMWNQKTRMRLLYLILSAGVYTEIY